MKHQNKIKNLYYRDTFARHNAIKLLFLSIFGLFTSYPRLLLEVFTRKNFGERYFRLSSAITLALILAVLPVGFDHISSGLGGSEMVSESYSFDESFGSDVAPVQSMEQASQNGLMPDYIGWYLYLVAFLFFSTKHYLANRRTPSAFNFKRFTLSSGVIHPFIRNIKMGGFSPDIRFIECYLEPAIFFVAGIVLALIGQTLGWLLIVCSFFYSMSYISAYIGGDNFVMDKIDEIICNETLETAFVDDGDIEETLGFKFRGSRPNTADMRRKILPLMTEDEAMEASNPIDVSQAKTEISDPHK